jgi:hypothetical protein
LVKQSQNSFSLTGLPAGVYTLDVITQKGDARAAYEGILVLGQEPTNIQTRTIIEQQIVRENDDDDGNNGNGSDGNCDPSYPNVCIRPYPPDLDCPEIQYTDFKVLPPDPHDFDREGDGIGCESGTVSISSTGPDGNETLLPPTDPCINNPNLPECPDPCIANAGAEGCPVTDPCEEDPSLPECQEDAGDSSDGDDESIGDSSDNDSGDESDEGTDGGDDGNQDENGDSSNDEGDDDNGDDNSGSDDGPVDFGPDGPTD